MKTTALLLTLALLAGCSYLRSVTEKTTDPKTGIVTERTTARAYTLLDANATLTRFRNASSGWSTNQFPPGTSIGTLNEASSATNLVSILSAVAQGVAAGLK